MYDPVWCCEDQSSFEPSTGQCLGYVAAPQAVACQGAYPTTQRVCTMCETNQEPKSVWHRLLRRVIFPHRGGPCSPGYFSITTRPPATDKVMLNFTMWMTTCLHPSSTSHPLHRGSGFQTIKVRGGQNGSGRELSDWRMVL